MLQLTLVRHAKAAPAARPGADFPRQLDARGRREAASMALRAQQLGLRPDFLFASPAARTLETAEAFARALAIAPARRNFDERLYLADRDTLLELVRTAPRDCRHAMLVGHNPGISRLAAGLAGDEDTAELPTAGLYGVGFDGQSWRDIGWHSGVATLLEVPGRRQGE